MFSLFEKANTYEKIKDFTFNELIKIIKDHPQKDYIESIRKKRRNGDLSYKSDKRDLLSFTPNCSVHSARKFSDGHFLKNFNAGSEYIYIDIDGVQDAFYYKKEFIKKYGDIVSLVAVSSSLGGLFILIKLNRLISSIEDFSIVWEHFNTNVFAGKVDTNTKDFNRVNFITCDPDVYINYENEYDIKDIGLKEKCKIEKRTFTTNSIPSTEISSKRASKIEIRDVLSNLIFKTQIDFNKHEIVKYQVVEDYIEVTQFGAISDGKKRSTFTAIMIALKYLNPETEKEKYIHAYLKCINGTRCTQEMDHKELDKLFHNTIDLVKNKNVKPPFKLKIVHTNKSSRETSNERQKLGADLSRKVQINDTIDNIKLAIVELQGQGVKKITNAAICMITGLHRNTVSNRRKELEGYNINELIEQVNESYVEDRSRFYNDGYIAREATYDN
jgi:hypothetical protein